MQPKKQTNNQRNVTVTVKSINNVNNNNPNKQQERGQIRHK